MNRREQLGDEMTRFCQYIEEYFPRIQKIYLFGSCLWKDLPTDIDIGIEGNDKFLKNGYKQLFPNIHLKRDKPRGTTSVVAWSRKEGVLLKELPFVERNVLIGELQNLRHQMEGLRKEMRGHSHSKGWDSYFGPY